MLLVDDILLSPVTSVLWLFKEIYKNAEAERDNEGKIITQELSELYMMLETGRITEAEFDAQESGLLDRLDAFNERYADKSAEEEDAK